jgi:tetratricopeptide (TPR) repeat protein
MNILHPLILSLTLLSISHAEQTPRQSMKQGLKNLQAGNHTNAIDHLQKTLSTFPDLGAYNLGSAHFQNGDYEEAAQQFQEALRSQDLALQANAYFNRGNALLAQTTTLTGPEQINTAITLTFEALEHYEQAILLQPDAIDAKQNYERAALLRLSLEFKRGKWSFDQAESLLTQKQAKQARTHYQTALQQFTKILNEIEPNHPESTHLLPRTQERLAMLEQALADARSDLTQALRLIQDYQYHLAANILIHQSDPREYAFDLDPNLKSRYDQTMQKNQQVLDIINQLLNQLNTAK